MGTYIGGPVSEDAYDGWADFARRHGVTITALLESLGELMGAGAPLRQDVLVTRARDIAAERLKRPGPRRR